MKKTRIEIAKDILYPVSVLLVALLAWQIAVWISGDRTTPVGTFAALGELLGEGEFWSGFGFTLLRALWAFGLSFIVALVLALCSAGSETVRRILSPVVTVVRSLPTMAVVLIFILVLPSSATTALVGTIVLFPTFYAALLPSALGVSRDLLEISLVCGANKLQRLRFVYLPSMAPSIAENAVSGLSLSVKLVVSAEVLAQTAKSIGMMMQTARAYLETERLVALTFSVVFVCVLIDAVGKSLVNALCKPQ